MNQVSVNQQVAITSVYFKKDFTSFPRRMEFDGASYTFRDGLQYCINKGSTMTRIFDMTDGETKFRLKSDREQSSWTLVTMSSHA